MTSLRYFLRVISRLGFGVWIALAGGLIGFIVAIIAQPIFGAILTLIFIWVFWNFMFRSMVDQERLADVGVETDAKIISVRETGSSLQLGGSMPKAGVILELEVRPKNGPAVTATTSTFLSVFDTERIKPGRMVKVKYDPADPRKVMLAEGTGALELHASGISKPEAEKMVDALAKEQQELLKIGVEKQATIVSARETGIHINGDNPLMEFVFDIQDDGGPYQATAKAPVARASLPKYTPGKAVIVKVDANDKNRLTLAGSRE